MEGLRFLVLSELDGKNEGPSAERRVYATGVLVIGNGVPESRDEFERLSNRSEPMAVLPLFYRCLADRLFLPVDSDLFPHVTASELKSLMPADSGSLLVWHPSAGLIQFEVEQVLTTSALLQGPVDSTNCWDAAQIGETLNDRIRSVTPDLTEPLDDIIQQGQDDIGQDSTNIADAPPSPDEVRHPELHDAVRSMKNLIARGIFAITDRLPDRPNGSQMLGRLHQWASSLVSGLGSGSASDGSNRGTRPTRSNLSSQRENELKRLLNLMTNDPEQGLRYALPLHGGSHRGKSSPSGRLGERSPDFHLSQLGGSGPADGWDLPWEYQVKLTQRYRDLAQRELRLGNHRRAAYIYATLLNDLSAAATALEAGGLHRDAATIYQKHLNNPLKAAECLRQGGFWEESLVIFRDRGRWIDAGELLLKLEQPDEARIMFSNEIKSCEARRDFLKAGELADQRLQDPERAAALMTEGWTLNASAEKCFRGLMDLHGRRGQHASARMAIQRLAGGPNLFVHQRGDAVNLHLPISI